MSTFMKSYSMISRLIKRQTDLLETALSGGLPEDMLYELYRAAAKVHWNLRIHEKALFEMLDFLREELFRVRDRLPEEARERINEVIKSMKQANAEAYIMGLLEDALTILGRGEDLLNEHVLWLEAFYLALKEEQPPPAFDPRECRLGCWLASLSFEVMSHKDPELRMKILSTHKELHEAARLAYDLYQKDEKDQALPLIRMVIENSFLLNSFLKELFLRWETSRRAIFLSFVKKRFLDSGLLILTFNRALTQLERTGLSADRLREEILEEVRKRFWFEEGVCLVEERESLYFVVDTTRFSYRRILRFLEEKAAEVNERYRDLLKTPVIAAGLVHPEKLKGLSLAEIGLLIQILEEYLADMEHEGPFVAEDLTPKLGDFLTKVRRQLEVTELLREAIKHGRFEIYCQPIYLLEGGPVGWYECLARLRDREGRVIPAGEFIPIVNREGWHEAFDEALILSLQEHLEEIRRFASRIFVNLHPRSLRSKEIAKLIAELARKAEELDLEIVLELTEYEELMRVELAERIKPGKVKLAIDDFGSGYANFELVGKLAERNIISYVKIDGSLVKNALHSATMRSVLESVVILALDLKLGVIFEYIENEEIVKMLREIPSRIKNKAFQEIDQVEFFGQGYHFSHPRPLEEWLRHSGKMSA